MVSHSLNLCSAFNPSKYTHTTASSEHTQSSGQLFFAVVPGMNCGFVALLKGLTSPCGVEAVVSWLFTPQSLLVPRLEPTTFGLQVQLSNH